MAAQILLTLLKISVLVLSIIQLVTCTAGEAGNEADKTKTADADNNVVATKRPLPPLPTDPRQLGTIFSLLAQLQAKRPAVWEMVKNTFDLSHLKLPQMVINFWNRYGWGKKETQTPTQPDQTKPQAPQKGTDSVDVEVREGSKPSGSDQSSNIPVQADKETPVQAEVSIGIEQVAPPSNEQAAQAEVPQPPAAVPSNTEEAHPVQAEALQPPAADSSNTQEANPVQAEVPQPPAADSSNTQEAKPVQAEVPQPPAADSSNTQEAKPVQAEVPQPPAAVPSSTQEAKPVKQSAESNPSQVAGSGSPLMAALRKPNTLGSATVEGDQPNPWARPPPAQAQPTDWQSSYQRTGDYVDYLKALLNEPEEEVLASVRHFH